MLDDNADGFALGWDKGSTCQPQLLMYRLILRADLSNFAPRRLFSVLGETPKMLPLGMRIKADGFGATQKSGSLAKHNHGKTDSLITHFFLPNSPTAAPGK